MKMQELALLLLCTTPFASVVNSQPQVKNIPLDANKNIYIRDVNRFRGSLDATAMRQVNWSNKLADESFRDAEILLIFFGCGVRKMVCESDKCSDKLVSLLLKQKSLFHENMQNLNVSSGIGRMFSFLGSMPATVCNTASPVETGFQSCYRNEYKVFEDTDSFGCSRVRCSFHGRDVDHLVCKFAAQRIIRPTFDGTSRLYRQASVNFETCTGCPATSPGCNDGVCVPGTAPRFASSYLTVGTIIYFYGIYNLFM